MSMHGERQIRLERIRRISSVMKWVVTAVLIAISVVSALLVFTLVLPALSLVPAGLLADSGIDRKLTDIPVVQRLGLAALVCLAFFLLRRLFWNIRQLFAQFHAGIFFAAPTQTYILNAGFWLLAFGVFDFLSDPVRSVLVSLDNAPGQRQLVLELGGGEFLYLIFGTLMLVFGWIMREAATLADENSQFI